MSRSRLPRLAVACLAVAVLIGIAARDERRPAAPVRVQAPPVATHGGARCPGDGAALDDAGYLALADRLTKRLGALWNPRRGRYDPGPGATTSQINADLLLVHATAARIGHRGPARDDARARAAARFLTGPEIWRQGRARPGWRASPDVGDMHPVFQAEVAEALAAAYRARRALGLDAATALAIERQLARVIASPAWRWPALLLNQFNWYATIAAADARSTGTTARSPRACGATSTASSPVRTTTSGLGCGSATTRAGRARHSTSTRPSTRTSCWASPAPTGRRARRGCPAGERRAAARVDAARAGRLLDARGLSELGHRARLSALAPAQEGGSRAGAR